VTEITSNIDCEVENEPAVDSDVLVSEDVLDDNQLDEVNHEGNSKIIEDSEMYSSDDTVVEKIPAVEEQKKSSGKTLESNVDKKEMPGDVDASVDCEVTNEAAVDTDVPPLEDLMDDEQLCDELDHEADNEIIEDSEIHSSDDTMVEKVPAVKEQVHCR
jgi:hypothetical protein